MYKNMLLHNIRSMDYYVLPFKFITNIIGGNGSGKTVFVDCLSMIVYGEYPNSMNLAGSEQRHIKGAVHWTTPKYPLGRRPGQTVSHIILEMQDNKGNVLCQGVRIVSNGVNKDRTTYTYFQSEGTLQEIGAGSKEELMRGVRMDEAGSRDDMMAKFYMRRGFQDTFNDPRRGKAARETYHQLCRGFLIPQRGGKVNVKLADFVRDNILPETHTGLRKDDMFRNINKITELSVKIQQHKQRVQFIQDATLAGEAYIEVLRAQRLLEEVVPIINKNNYEEEKEKHIKAKEDLARTIEDYNKAKDANDRECEEYREEYMKYQNKSEALRAAQAAYDFLSEASQNAEAAHLAALDHEKQEQKLRDTYRITGNVPEALKSMAEKHQEEAVKKEGQVQEAKAACQDAINTVKTLRGQFGQESATANNDVRRIEDANKLLRMIRKECPEAGAKILYQCVDEVKDLSWQNAVENMIGTDRYGIVVHPDYHNRAVIIQKRFSEGRGDTYILNTKNMLHGATRPTKNGSIPTLFTYNNIYAERYIGSSYGDVMLCDDDSRFLQERRAIRKNMQYKGTRRTTKPGAKSRNIMLLFGSEAIKKEIERFEAKAAEAEKEEAKARKEAEALRGKAKELDKIRDSFMLAESKYNPDAHEQFRQVQEKLKQAEEDLEKAKSSDEEVERNRKLAAIQSQIDLRKKKNEEYIRAITNKELLMSEEQHQIDVATGWLNAHPNVADQYPELSARDEGILDKYGLRTCFGDAMINQKRRDLSDNSKEKKDQVDRATHNEAMHETFIDLPVHIYTEEDLKYYKQQNDLYFETDIRNEDQQELCRLQEDISQVSIELLNKMYEEYTNAKAMRERFNKYISKYNIGHCYYRLSELEINRNAENSEMMEYAILLGEGMHLTENQMKNVLAIAKRVWNDGREKNWNVFDYRKYIRTMMECRAEDTDYWKDARPVLESNSTGQQSILRYIFRIAVIAHQAFTDNSVNIIISDESLEGVDTGNGKYFFETLRQMNIQCIIAYWNTTWVMESDTVHCVRMSKDGYIVVSTAGKDKPGATIQGEQREDA